MKMRFLLTFVLVFSIFCICNIKSIQAEANPPLSYRIVEEGLGRSTIMDEATTSEIRRLRQNWMPRYPVLYRDIGRGMTERDSFRRVSKESWDWWNTLCTQRREGPSEAAEQCERIHKLAVDSFEGQ